MIIQLLAEQFRKYSGFSLNCHNGKWSNWRCIF